MSLWRLE